MERLKDGSRIDMVLVYPITNQEDKEKIRQRAVFERWHLFLKHVTGKLQKGSTKVFMTWLTIIACISPKIIKQPCLEKSPFSVLQYFSSFSLFSGISGSSKDLFWNIKRYFYLQQEKVMLRVKNLAHFDVEEM